MKELCKSKLIALYGEDAPESFVTRLNFELNSILVNGYDSHYLSAKNLVDEAQKYNYPIFARGTVGSSFAAFLLGITNVNPLKPHYLCIQCKRVELINSVKSGYDLPDRVCPDCGSMMKGDGHAIAFAFFAGTDLNKPPNFEFATVNDFLEKAEKLLQNMNTKLNPLSIHAVSEHYFKQTNFDEEMFKLCNPKCFSDYVKAEALKHGTGVWAGNAETLIKTGKADLKEILATREDVYDCLIESGMKHKEAFLLTEKIYKGKGNQLDSEELKNYRLPEWFLESAGKMEYMFPRAHCCGLMICRGCNQKGFYDEKSA